MSENTEIEFPNVIAMSVVVKEPMMEKELLFADVVEYDTYQGRKHETKEDFFYVDTFERKLGDNAKQVYSKDDEQWKEAIDSLEKQNVIAYVQEIAKKEVPFLENEHSMAHIVVQHIFIEYRLDNSVMNGTCYIHQLYFREGLQSTKKEYDIRDNVFTQRNKKKDSTDKLVQEALDDAKKRLLEEEKARKAKEEADRKAREEAERKAKEEADRKAREEAVRKAREEADRKEAERKAKEEAERKARQEAARKEAEMKAKEEADRKAREEAERKAKEEEAERKAKEEEAARKDPKSAVEVHESVQQEGKEKDRNRIVREIIEKNNAVLKKGLKDEVKINLRGKMHSLKDILFKHLKEGIRNKITLYFVRDLFDQNPPVTTVIGQLRILMSAMYYHGLIHDPRSYKNDEFPQLESRGIRFGGFSKRYRKSRKGRRQTRKKRATI